MTKTNSNINPWTGPQPYDERRWRRFHGRRTEINTLVSKVSTQRLTLLSGGSGTGKTSLVRAGLVPKLRIKRYQNSDGTWPVLVLRSWGAETGTSLETMMISQLRTAINAIREWGRHPEFPRAAKDADALEASLDEGLEAEESIYALLEALPGAVESENGSEGDDEGGIILIFDQFEELVRGRTLVQEALELIGYLFRTAAPIRILISLRSEYEYALRPLEKRSGALSTRAVFLAPLRESTVKNVITRASKDSDVEILEDVAEAIVDLLRQERKERKRIHERAEADTGRPDLLKLQALLLELTQFAQEEGAKTVDPDLLTRFYERLGGNPKRVVGESLRRWIEKAIKKEIEEDQDVYRDSAREVRDSQYKDWSEIPEPALTEQVRHIAARIAPNMSALDYKVPQEENDLFKLALEGDVWNLGMKDAQKRDSIRIQDPDDSSQPELNWEELGLSDSLDGRAKDYVSGFAKQSGWTPSQTANKLVICFREALHRLAIANILKRTRLGVGDEKYIWELVHDQMGETFTTWAREYRDTWDDCRNSLAVCRGIQPLTVKGYAASQSTSASTGPCIESTTLEKLSWQGSTVEPPGSQPLVLDSVLFDDCFLIGMIFDRCVFIGGGFRRCIMDGVLFRDCTFLAGEDGKAFEFSRCDSSSVAIIESRIDMMEFRDCRLRQPTIRRSKLLRNVSFAEESRILQGYFQVDPWKDLSEAGPFFSGARETPTLEPTLSFDETSLGFSCTAVPYSMLRFPDYSHYNTNFKTPPEFSMERE